MFNCMQIRKQYLRPHVQVRPAVTKLSLPIYLYNVFFTEPSLYRYSSCIQPSTVIS